MIGESLGHYRVLEKLGAGGMGEVYRAKDTRLGRDVAVKVLPAAFSSDAQRMARLEREAQVLASLNHPHIAAIYGMEESGANRALVMELVDGPTLADRIRQGAIPLDEALPIARQIAEALEYAHDHGIIHRDLKPANIKITKDGAVKVLDFGLAKAFESEMDATDLSSSPTISMAATRAGIILGTAAYMSPEQARGTHVDKRSDIWAFGVVLYEMLTGRQTFTGETASDTLAAVLRADLDWTGLPADTPPGVRRLLQRCLERDRKRRLRDIGDARLELDESQLATSESMAFSARDLSGTSNFRRFIFSMKGIAALLVLGLLAGTALSWLLLRTKSVAVPSTRFSVPSPSGSGFVIESWPALALSPDGRLLVFSTGPEGKRQLYMRWMDRMDATPLPDTMHGVFPFFSPDGKWIGFVSEGKLKKIPIEGGPAVVLCDVGDMRGASWGEDDTIILTPTFTTGLSQLPASGGTPQPITTLDAARRERTHRWPEILPGGKAVLFTIGSVENPDNYDDAEIVVQALPNGPRKMLVHGAMAHYSSSGHLLFARTGTLYAAPFDLRKLELTGPSIPIVDAIVTNPPTGAVHFAVSREGSLAFIPGTIQNPDQRLIWTDLSGVTKPIPPFPEKAYREPHLSPDGKRLAVTIRTGARDDIWVADLARGVLTRLTFEGTGNFSPVWTPDGKRIIYSSTRGGPPSLFWRPSDGSGQEEPFTTPTSGIQQAESVSPDGEFVAFTQADLTKLQPDIWIVPIEGGPSATFRAGRTPRPFLQTSFEEYNPRFSPNGKWLAYVSTESGKEEVYVQSFPGPGGKWQVSVDGGELPEWSRDGHEIFFIQNRKLCVALISPQSEFSSSAPKVLFEKPVAAQVPGIASRTSHFAVSLDGKQFLSTEPTAEVKILDQIQVVLNFSEELKKRAPAKK
ncbi:MAG: serine/threonine-protein kinase [Acidobacteria bacterium]|nr:serine/threonine-protein kinase [Acidobacteriota bacterium]